MKIGAKLRNDIINFLIRLPALHSENGRKAILLSAGLDDVLPSIELNGNTKEFVTLLVKNLAQYGMLPDQQPALIHFLQAVSEQVGLEGQKIIQAFCHRLTTPPKQLSETCPYRGLSAFREQDAGNFFGRIEIVQELYQLIQEQSFVALIGASGSGKSSLVSAGLIPRLRETREWVIVSFRPRNQPFSELASACFPLLYPNKVEQAEKLTESRKKLKDGNVSLEALARAEKLTELSKKLKDGNVSLEALARLVLEKSPEKRLFLIADQFEELYALTQNHSVQQRFVDNLLQAVNAKVLTLLLTLRADFMTQALDYAPLAKILDRYPHKFLGRMDEEQLLAAIEEPTKKSNIQIEAGLSNRILQDVGQEPGNLPLLEFALTQLWGQMEDFCLTHIAYDEIGGVSKALTLHADAVYANFKPTEQEKVRRILVQLVSPGQNTKDTRQVATREQVQDWEIVKRLADKHLVVTGRDEQTQEETVEVVHEALIQYWQPLREWIEKDHNFRAWQERLRTDMRRWEQNNQDEGALLYGATLSEAENWLNKRSEDIKRKEQCFIEASIRQREREIQTKRRLQRGITFTLVTGLVIAIISGVLSVVQWRKADEQTQITQKALVDLSERKQQAEEARDEAQQQTRIARARQLAAESQVVLEKYPQRSLLLALEALNVTLQENEPRVPAAEEALRQALAGSGGLGLSGNIVAFSPGSHWLATGSDDGIVRLWDLTATDPVVTPVVLHGHEGWIEAIAFSPNNRWLATGGVDGIVRLWNLTGSEPPASPIVLHWGKRPYNLAFSPDNKWLVSSDKYHIALWDLTVTDIAAAPAVFYRHETEIKAVAFSPNSDWLAIRSEDTNARLWDLASENLSTTLVVLHGHERDIETMAFSPDSRWFVTGSRDATAQLWDLTTIDPTAIPIVLYGHEDVITSVAISSDSRWLVTGSRDATARLWDLAATDPVTPSLVLRGHGGPITSVAISSDSRWLVTASNDQTSRLWNLTATNPATNPVILYGYEGEITTVIFSLDSHWLVTISKDNTIRLWNLKATNPAVTSIILHGHEEAITGVAFSSDSHWLVTGSDDGTSRLWDLTTPDPTSPPAMLDGNEGDIWSAAFSPNSHWLVTGSDNGIARLWDLTTPNSISMSTELCRQQRRIWKVIFSSDNRWLTISSDDGTARLWDLTRTDLVEIPLILYEHEGPITNITFSPDSHWLITNSDSGITRLWNLVVPNPLASSIVLNEHEDGIITVAFSTDGHWLFTGSRLWNLTAIDQAAVPLVLSEQEDSVRDVIISPDSHWLVASSEYGDYRLWDLTMVNSTLVPIILPRSDEKIATMTISPDSHWLVTAENRLDLPKSRWYTPAILLWDLTALNPAATPIVLGEYVGMIKDVAFSPDSHWLAIGSDDSTARLWNLTAPNLLSHPVILNGHEDGIASLAFSKDSHWLVTGSWDSTARLWDLTAVASDTTAVVLRGHEDEIWKVEISPDDRWLLTRSRDGMGQLWKLRQDELIEDACRIAGRNLSLQEWEKYFPGEKYRKICPKLSVHSPPIRPEYPRW